MIARVLLLTDLIGWLHTGSSSTRPTVGCMGRGIRRVILSCVVAAVRHEFPEDDGGFKLAEL